MYDVRQFKPALYCLLFLGVCGFAMGAESGMLFILGTMALLLNAWLVRRGWFKPMPRLISNIVTIGALIYVVHEVLTSGGTDTIMLIGEFLMLLQMVKLWEQRGNRDYGQLLVLSLLLMVAAAISTRSVFFGILMIGYLFVSLYCCLLFHLKVEADAAKAALTTAQRKINPAVLRQDQRKFASSMRKLTGMISTVAMLFAVLVFILFPRGTGAGMLGQYKPTQEMVGFSDEVSFKTFGKIQQNEAIVAFVGLKHDGQEFRSRPLLLRGVTLDTYTGKSGEWTWVRWPRVWYRHAADARAETYADFIDGEVAAGGTKKLVEKPPLTDLWEQKITLLPTGTSVLFAMAGPCSIEVVDPTRQLAYRISPRDSEMHYRNLEADGRPRELNYKVVSSDDLGNQAPPPGSGTPAALMNLVDDGGHSQSYPVALSAPITLDGAAATLAALPKGALVELELATDRRTALAVKALGAAGHLIMPSQGRHASGTLVSIDTVLDPLIRSYVLDPARNVTGRNEKGSLAAQRLEHVHANSEPDDLDEEIARNIESYLKSAKNGFTYTLDLTDAKREAGRDPMVAFLYDVHEGHCQYYAGAMTLMCQSLGMKARMCLGFRCNEYNGTPGAGYYMVRQSHAHAWVEVLTRDGWKSFDPTAEEDSKKQAAQQGFMQNVKHFFNFLQFTYGNSIIAFSNEDRTNLLQRTESVIARATAQSRPDRVSSFHLNELLSSTKYWTISSGLIFAAMMLMAVVALAVIARFVRDRWRLRRRAARIGISALSHGEQLRLARQLEFYDDLLTLLSRHQIRRPPHQTPLEFSKSLLFLPAGVYEAIRRLTELFYRVRYGQAELTPPRQRRLGRMIEKLGGEMSGKPAK